MNAGRRRLAWIACAFAACAPERLAEPEPPLRRSGRFGSLRDFVLFERTVDGAPLVLFLDRFEATRGDWLEFARAPEGAAVDAARVQCTGDPALPIAGVDLRQARAFARWRLARLPRTHEWFVCAIGERRNRFPWGSREDSTRTNTGELGLGEPTPVGTFESGRRSEDNQPYDLIGNVSEWTETVPLGWCAPERAEPQGGVVDPVGGFGSSLGRVRSSRALAVWSGVGGIVPSAWAVAAAGPAAPHEVVGSDFQSPMAQTLEVVFAGDRRQRTGIRLCATPRELLRALLDPTLEPTAAEWEQVRRFLDRPGHRAALFAAWPHVAAAEPARLRTPIGRFLAAAFGAAGSGGG